MVHVLLKLILIQLYKLQVIETQRLKSTENSVTTEQVDSPRTLVHEGNDRRRLFLEPFLPTKGTVS